MFLENSFRKGDNLSSKRSESELSDHGKGFTAQEIDDLDRALLEDSITSDIKKDDSKNENFISVEPLGEAIKPQITTPL